MTKLSNFDCLSVIKLFVLFVCVWFIKINVISSTIFSEKTLHNGISSNNLNIREQMVIIDGQADENGFYTYVTRFGPKKHAFCSGVLLKEEWILSNTDCLKMYEEKKFTHAYAGPKSKEQKRKIEKGFFDKRRHNKTSLSANNLALFKVKPFELEYGLHVAKISHVQWSENKEENCLIAGYGPVSSNQSKKLSAVALFKEYKTGKSKDLCPCTSTLERQHIICVQPEAGKGPCPGDIGGPLICQHLVHGIYTHLLSNSCKNSDDNSSWGDISESCAGKNVSIIYTQITHWLRWIKNVTEDDQEDEIEHRSHVQIRDYTYHDQISGGNIHPRVTDIKLILAVCVTILYLKEIKFVNNAYCMIFNVINYYIV